MQVDPELAANVVLDAWVLLIMEPIQGAAHHRVHLWDKAASESSQERSWQLQNTKTPVDPAMGTPTPQMNGNQQTQGAHGRTHVQLHFWVTSWHSYMTETRNVGLFVPTTTPKYLRVWPTNPLHDTSLGLCLLVNSL